MEKVILSGKVKDGIVEYALGIDQGKLVAQISAPIDADLDKLAELIPGSIDNIVIGLIKSAAKM